MSNDSIVKFRPFAKVAYCFDIVAVFDNNVAGFGNNVERNFVLSTKSKQIEHVPFVLLFPFSLSYSLRLFSCFFSIFSISSHSTRIVAVRFQAGCRRRRWYFVDCVLCVFCIQGCMLVFVIFDLVLSCGVIVVSSFVGASVIVKISFSIPFPFCVCWIKRWPVLRLIYRWPSCTGYG